MSKEETRARLKLYYYKAETGNGMCMICGELSPFFLEAHHLLGKKNDNLEVTLCANCHRKYKTGDERHERMIMEAIERRFERL